MNPGHQVNQSSALVIDPPVLQQRILLLNRDSAYIELHHSIESIVQCIHLLTSFYSMGTLITLKLGSVRFRI